MVIQKSAWICIENQLILTTRSRNKDVFYIPGGKPEKGESNVQALIREIKEELTVDLNLDSIEFLGVFEAQAHGHPSGTTVQMNCYGGAYSGILQPHTEIAEIAWLSYAEKHKTSHVDHLIFDWLKSNHQL